MYRNFRRMSIEMVVDQFEMALEDEKREERRKVKEKNRLESFSKRLKTKRKKKDICNLP